MVTRAMSAMVRRAPAAMMERRIAALEAAVATLRREVAELQHAHARSRRRTREDSSQVSQADDARWLSALAARFGGELFSAVQVRDSCDSEVRAAFAGLSARQIGAWLRRMQACSVAPYQVRSLKREGAGRVWELTVDVSADRHTHGCQAAITGG